MMRLCSTVIACSVLLTGPAFAGPLRLVNSATPAPATTTMMISPPLRVGALSVHRDAAAVVFSPRPDIVAPPPPSHSHQPGAAANSNPPVATPWPAPHAGPAGHVYGTGTPPPVIPPRTGWGRDVPLSLALQQIVPSSWSIVWTHDVPPTRLVSWTGGSAWSQVLDRLASTGGVDILLNWTDRQATVGPAGTMHAPPVRVAIAPKPVQVWRLDPTLTLRQNVEAWARRAGWNAVVWEGADYPVHAPATFTGSFAADNGPLASLIRGYAHSEHPLAVRLTLQDRVIRVFDARPSLGQPEPGVLGGTATLRLMERAAAVDGPQVNGGNGRPLPDPVTVTAPPPHPVNLMIAPPSHPGAVSLTPSHGG